MSYPPLNEEGCVLPASTMRLAVTWLSSRGGFVSAGAHDWQKIRFVLIFERFPHFLMGCVG